jgi:hypothetical protein
MNEIDKNDAVLEQLFEAAKAADPVPSGDLMARIMADAASVQAQPVPVAPLPVPRGFGQVLSEVFGGWAGASTLAACVGLGLLFGFSSPDTILSFVPGSVAEAADDSFTLYFDTEL